MKPRYRFNSSLKSSLYLALAFLQRSPGQIANAPTTIKFFFFSNSAVTAPH